MMSAHTDSFAGRAFSAAGAWASSAVAMSRGVLGSTPRMNGPAFEGASIEVFVP